MRLTHGPSLALACLLLAALPLRGAAAQESPPEPFDPDGGSESAADSGAQRQLSREQIRAIAEAVAASAPGSVEEFRALEERVAATAAKVRPAVVAMVLNSPDRKGAGSGALISADGWILTAAHVCETPGIPLTIYLADGTELKGRSAGQHMDRNQDVGLVKVETNGRALPFLELGKTDALKVGQTILMFGHPLGPEIKPWRPPPLRVGHVLSSEDGIVCMDAPVTPGDSGGPVVDLDGRIIGITSVASMLPSVNAAVAVETAISRMDEMRRDSKTGAGLADGAPSKVWVDPGKAFEPVAMESQRQRSMRERETLEPLVFQATGSVVTVLVDSREASLGVLVDAEGHVLTKASEVGLGPRIVQVAMPDGATMPATRVAQDERLDLMLLATGVSGTEPLQFDDADPSLGALVISVGKGMAPAAVGYRSLDAYDAGASDQASRSLIGIQLRTAGAADHLPVPAVIITKLYEGSGAKEAGLLEGDALLSVDGVPFTSADAPASVLRQHAPGDSVTIEYMRAGVRRTATVRLQRPPFEAGPGNIGAELSRRSTGFGPVLQHDGIVPAMEMGAPILDSQGHVVGLNIARAERSKTYALPSSVVKPALARLMKAAQEGRSVEPPDLRTVLDRVEFGADGRALLAAAAARISGPTVSLARTQESGAAEPASASGRVLQGFASVEDDAVWVLSIPAAGRYEFELEAAGLAGGRMDLFVGNELMTVRIPPAEGEPTFQTVHAGEALIEEAGPMVVRVQPLDRPRGPVMLLRGVRASRSDVRRNLERALPMLRSKDLDRLRRELERDERRDKARKANEESERRMQEEPKSGPELPSTPERTP